ncbi:Mov34/MPN/PAD-1 family protein [Elioraea rosea]|uniref:Mov34/MPN/PAD-1 family protein n=1 Tax=Elioraea rosea TaxID=2492390 RepID=UPI001183F6BC|nr:Mov34/MPN/PAD-1 family protein [Elioraea rosea]
MSGVVRLHRAVADALPRLAAAAAPREACGLLLGRRVGEALVLDGIAPSRNLAAAEDEFELDTALHLRLQRQTRAAAGVWHSHVSGRALPSARDARGAWDPALVWLITAAGETTAWMPEGEGQGFSPLRLEIG